jgi:hypothetical protein
MASPAPSPIVQGVGRRSAALLATFAALLAVFLFAVRPWYLTWGATTEEVHGPLPGDDHALGAARETRAIAIDAPAATVFAWVAQLGQDRAGFYSYELLEDLVGCEMPDLRHLDPALQRWSVGDRLWMYPPSKLEGKGHATLLSIEPERALVFGTHGPADPPGAAPTGTWSFIVKSTGANSSRLLTRASAGSQATLLGTVYTWVLFEPIHFAMERRMLEGIKGLAEGRPLSRWRDGLQLFAWFTSFALFVVSALLALVGYRFERRLLGFAASGLVFQIVTLTQPAPIVGISLVMALLLIVWPLPARGSDTADALVERASLDS